MGHSGGHLQLDVGSSHLSVCGISFSGENAISMPESKFLYKNCNKIVLQRGETIVQFW